MTDSYDAREFLTSNFVKKDELRQNGPMRFTIKAVEKADGIAKNGAAPKQILQLISTDDRRQGLGTQANLKRVIEFLGVPTSGWVGKTIELYYSPDVRSPSGEEGGIRVRLPEQPAPAGPVEDYAAALTSELPPAKAKGRKA